MNADLIHAKIESLARCVQRIEQRVPNTSQELKADPDLQDILPINLERAVQLCVDIALHWIAQQPSIQLPSTMGEAFRVMESANLINKELANQLISVVGFRNLSVHSYEKINWDIVWSIATKEIDLFRNFSRCVLESLKTP